MMEKQIDLILIQHNVRQYCIFYSKQFPIGGASLDLDVIANHLPTLITGLIVHLQKPFSRRMVPHLSTLAFPPHFAGTPFVVPHKLRGQTRFRQISRYISNAGCRSTEEYFSLHATPSSYQSWV